MKIFNQFSLLIVMSLASACSVFNLFPSKNIGAISFSEEATFPDLELVYQSESNSPKLAELRHTYALDAVVEVKVSDISADLLYTPSIEDFYQKPIIL